MRKRFAALHFANLWNFQKENFKDVAAVKTTKQLEAPNQPTYGLPSLHRI